MDKTTYSEIFNIISVEVIETRLSPKPKIGNYAKKRISNQFNIENDIEPLNENNKKSTKHVSFGSSNYVKFESLSNSTEGRMWHELRDYFLENKKAVRNAGGVKNLINEELDIDD